MSENQTEKSRYPSKYSAGNYVTAAQYITELICEKLAKKQKKVLIQQFWKNSDWSKFYKQQILAAYGLLKLYPEKAIIAALKAKASWNVYSLRAPHLDKMIRAEQSALELELKSKDVIEVNDDKEVLSHRKPEEKTGLFDKLRGL